MLANNGRLVIISFNSLEDYVIKSFINFYLKSNNCHYKKCSFIKLYSFKKINVNKTPNILEVCKNISSKSSTIRVFEKIVLL